MYKYVTDKKFLSAMRQTCGAIMQDTCRFLKQDYEIGTIFYLIGSGAKNLITQNAAEPIDLDYNLEIVKSTKWFSFKQGNRTPFCIDLCIVHKDSAGRLQRLIHNKNSYSLFCPGTTVTSHIITPSKGRLRSARRRPSCLLLLWISH